MTVSNELIDRLLADYRKPEDIGGENGLLKQLTKRLVERTFEAEMAEHLGHAKNGVGNAPVPWSANSPVGKFRTTNFR
jgi:transposase-like protein